MNFILLILNYIANHITLLFIPISRNIVIINFLEKVKGPIRSSSEFFILIK